MVRRSAARARCDRTPRARAGHSVTRTARGTTARQSTDDGTVAASGTSRSFTLRCRGALVGISAIAAGLQAGDGIDVEDARRPHVGDRPRHRRAGLPEAGTAASGRRGQRGAGAACRAWCGPAAARRGPTTAWPVIGNYPFPSAADVGWLGYALPAGIGLLNLRSRATLGSARLGRTLDRRHRRCGPLRQLVHGARSLVSGTGIPFPRAPRWPRLSGRRRGDGVPGAHGHHAQERRRTPALVWPSSSPWP